MKIDVNGNYAARNRIALDILHSRETHREREEASDTDDVDLNVSKLDALEHVKCKLYCGSNEYYEPQNEQTLHIRKRITGQSERTSRIVKYAIFMIFNGVNRHKIQL